MSVDQHERHRDQQNPAHHADRYEPSQSGGDCGDEHQGRRYLPPLGGLGPAAEHVDADHTAEQRHADEAPVIGPQNDDREQKLEAEAPEDGAHFDFAAMLGNDPRDAQKHGKAEKADKLHGGLL